MWGLFPKGSDVKELAKGRFLFKTIVFFPVSYKIVGQERNVSHDKVTHRLGWTKFILYGCLLSFYKSGR